MSYCSFDKNSFLYYIDENTLYSFLVTITFVVIGIFLYILNSYTFFEKRKIPRPIRPVAPFGNLKDVLFKKSTFHILLWKNYNRFKRKGCSFGGLYLFFKPGILVVNSKLMNNIFLDEKGLFIDVCTRNNSNKNYAKLLKIFNNESVEILLDRCNKIKENIVNNLKKDCIIETVINDFCMELTFSAFGLNSSEEVLGVVNKVLHEKHSSSFQYFLQIIYPIFKRIKMINDKETLIEQIIKYRKKNDVRKTDLLQNFINLLNEDSSCKFEELAPCLFDIFVNNITYSHSTLLFCLYELAANDEIQIELIEEIKKCTEKNKIISVDNLHGLTYLDAVVKETFRKYPPVSSVFKECKQNYNEVESGLNIPKGSYIFASILGVHRDSANYHDPELFDPNRFFEKEVDDFSVYVPFGFDVIKNIGSFLTTVHVKLGLISILSLYRVILTDNKHLMEFDYKKLNLHPKGQLPLKFKSLL